MYKYSSLSNSRVCCFSRVFRFALSLRRRMQSLGHKFLPPFAAWSLPPLWLVSLVLVSIATVQAPTPQSGPCLCFGGHSTGASCASPAIPRRPFVRSVTCINCKTELRLVPRMAQSGWLFLYPLKLFLWISWFFWKGNSLKIAWKVSRNFGNQ